jgi:two-component system, chemotaxis family, sensor kinase CheA
MTLDLAQFHDAFFEESFEALDSMEAALLKLDLGAPDAELINTIFRVAHSIKGGSATFGFKNVAEFTHSLETLLDELRGQRMQVTQALSDLLLRSVDVMRGMLRATQSNEAGDANAASAAKQEIEQVIAGKGASTAAMPTVAPIVAAAPTSAAANNPVADRTIGSHGWRIAFRPLPELLAHGNDPIRLFDELAALGSLTVTAEVNALPALADLAPDVCAIRWTLVLHSEVTREVVASVFEWAEGECELTIESLGEPNAAPSVSVTPPAAPAQPAAPTAAAAPTASQSAAPAVSAKAPANGDNSSIRVSIEKIDELMNTVGELVITQSMLAQLGSRVDGTVGDRLRAGLTQLERNMRELQDSVMRVRMLPISFVFSRFPRMVRDLAQRLGKHVELKITGESTELDKTVMEKIGDPLVHLVRNSIDHGLEGPDDRRAAGKDATGTVFLNAYHKGGSIVIEVADDGRGLAKQKIRAKAEGRGLVTAADVLTDAQVCELIFLPGFSTVEQATDLSGRGVGMDVVRRNITELGGSVELSSEVGKGTRFVITLPLTLAIVDGQTVAVGGQTYIVPLLSIIESLQLKPGMVNRVVGRGDVFAFRGEYVPIVRLYEVFGVKPRTTDLERGLVMVVEGEGKRIGLFVDQLLGQQQVVIKSLETNYKRIEGVAGATILGDGEVALILDLTGLVRAATQRAAA